MSLLCSLGSGAPVASTPLLLKDDKIWAFQLGSGSGDLISTGCVFRSTNWDELGAEPGRGSWVEHQVLQQRHSGRYRLIEGGVLFEAAIASHLFVAIANPDDPTFWHNAVKLCEAVGRFGVATILIAARLHSGLYAAEAIPVPSRSEVDRFAQWEEGSWKFYAGSHSDPRIAASRNPYVSGQAEFASCVVETITGDVYLELTSTVEAIGLYWKGAIGADFEAVREVLGTNGFGWKAWGVAHGKNRGATAAREAMEALHASAGPNLGQIREVIASVLTGQDHSSGEFVRIREVISELLPSAHVLLNHVCRPDHHTFVQVNVLALTKNTVRLSPSPGD